LEENTNKTEPFPLQYDFAVQKDAWISIPIEEGYLDAATLLNLPPNVLFQITNNARIIRYSTWRNIGGTWRKYLGLDTTEGKLILDYGCGIGTEANEFARLGNRVVLADINWDSILLAVRVMALINRDKQVVSCSLISGEWPYIISPKVDIFYACGVLHHIPYAESVIQRARELLNPGGEVRLMLYSDKAWEKHVGTPPPEDVAKSGGFVTFVQAMDQVGFYSDWYNEKKIVDKFCHGFALDSFHYLGNPIYCVATLKKL